jgi:RNA polymerase sigma-70 factor (ECF subfamily)
VYAYVAARVRDRATTEDVTSEVFHKALANLSSYEWRGVPFAAWLLRIAANAVVDQVKRSARQVSAFADPPEPTKAEVRVVEDRARLFRFVGELPETQRQVIQQRFVEQRSIREIAERLGKTEGAIKQLQLRAIERLRAQMGGGHG